MVSDFDAIKRSADVFPVESDLLIKAYGQWTWGFWSGLNLARQRQGLDHKDLNLFGSASDVASVIVTQCVDTPDVKVLDAAFAVHDRLREARS